MLLIIVIELLSEETGATGKLITGMFLHLEPSALYPKNKLYITSPTWLTKPQEPDNEPL